MQVRRQVQLLTRAKLLIICLREKNARLEKENAELRRINLDLGRYALSLLEGLVVEINDPGTLPEDTILIAASDMADQVARMEEHHV